jgi:hypothetical protein
MTSFTWEKEEKDYQQSGNLVQGCVVSTSCLIMIAVCKIVVIEVSHRLFAACLWLLPSNTDRVQPLQ